MGLGGISIEWILLLVIGVITILSILVGLIQGFRKSMFKFVSTIVFWIIFWITAPLITGKSFLWNNEWLYSILSGVLPEVSGDANCLMDFIKLFIADMAGIDAASLAEPAIENTIIAIAHGIIKIVWLILLAILYSIVKAIVYKAFFKKYFSVSKRKLKKLEKKQEKYIKKHGEPNAKLEKRITRTEKAVKRNKIYTPLGMVSGTLRGLLTSFLILSVINSTVRLLPELKKDDLTASNGDTKSNPTIYDFILSYCGDDPIVKGAIDMIADYQSSNLMNITGIKINNQSADELFIDSIISGKSEDYSFGLRKELKSVVTIAENAYYLTNGFDVENVAWTALTDSQIQNIETILNILSDDDLINNLGSALVGVAVSLDAVAEYMPKELSVEEYKNIDWGNELATIATLVSKVYSLGDDLAQLDYFDLDTNTVEDIFTTLSSLESINFLGHVGANLAIKNLVPEDATYTDTIESIENKLADLAVNGGYSSTIEDYSTLYTQFISIFTDEALDKYKEDGKITNYVAALTSVDTQKYSGVVNTVLEANFVSEVLPDVLTIVKEELIPEEYASLINPSVVTSIQWEKEINTVLTIVHDITTDSSGVIHPFETIEKYDFELLSGFTPETVVESDLLSYAMIKLFVDTSKQEGVLSEVAGDIANYVRVPDSLTTLDTTNHKFADKWYGNKSNEYRDGELFIMLNTIKNAASQLENLNYPATSIPAIMGVIDANELLQSDVLYYTLDKLIDDNREFIVVPKADTQVSMDTVNGLAVQNMIKRDSLVDALKAFTNPNIIDIESLFVYYKLNEDGTRAETPTPVEDIVNMEDYVAIIDTSTEKIVSLLTSDKLTANEENLNTLFASNVLRATITNLLTEEAGDIIVVPSNSTSGAETVLKLVENEHGEKVLTEVSMNIIEKQQFSAVIHAVNDLGIDLGSLMGENSDPLSIIDSLKDENGNIKPEVNKIFGVDGYNDSKYSGILHATLSKYVLDIAKDETMELKIVIPSKAIDPTDEKLIESQETVNLIQSLAILGTDMFTNENASQDEMIDDVIGKVLENNNALNSTIIRATLTKYIDDSEGINIPTAAYDNVHTDVHVVKKNEIVDLLKAIDALRVVRNQELASEGKPAIGYIDLLDINNMKVSTLYGANNLSGNPISSSLVLRGILTDQIQGPDKVIDEIPVQALENGVISVSETNSLIGALNSILGGDTSVSNINVDEIKVKNLADAKNDIKNSIVIRRLLTNELEKQATPEGDIGLPSSAYDSEIPTIISASEVDTLIEGLEKILDAESSVTSLNIDSITTEKIQSANDEISSSKILNATITKQLKKQADVVIPANAYADANKELLQENELKEMINGLVNLLGTEQTVNNINIDNIKVEDIKNAKNNVKASLVLNATITKQVSGQEGIKVPVSAYQDANATDKLLTSLEMDTLIEGLVALLGEDQVVTSIDVNSIKVEAIDNAKIHIKTSKVLNATITGELKKQSDVVVPTGAYDALDENKELLDADEMDTLITGLVNLLGTESSVSNINIDDIVIADINNAKSEISTSKVLNATITKQVSGQADIVVPVSAYQDVNATEKMVKVQEMETLIDGLVKLLGTESSVSNINVDNIKVADIDNAKTDISSSLILNATITKQVSGQEGIKVPVSAYQDATAAEKMLTILEMDSLIDGLVALLGEDQVVTSINVNTIKVEAIDNAKVHIKTSKVLNATITGELKKQSDVVVPTGAYDALDGNKELLDADEMDTLITGLVNLLGTDAEVSNINIDDIVVADINNAKSEISTSKVLNATITKQVSGQEDILVPTAVYQDVTAVEKMLKEQEMNTLISGLVTLLGTEQKVNNINIDEITVQNIYDTEEGLYSGTERITNDYISSSKILNATVTKQIVGVAEVKVPTSTYTIEDETIKLLKTGEIKNLVSGLLNLLGGKQKVNGIIFDNLKVQNIYNAKNEIADSKILNATVTEKIVKNDSVVVPITSYTIEDETIKLLKQDEVVTLITGLGNLLGLDTLINDIDINNVYPNDISSAKTQIIDSQVLNATITKNVSTGDVVVPVSAYQDAAAEDKMLEPNEMDSLITGLVKLLDSNQPVTNIDVSTITVAKIHTAESDISDSLVLNATITKQLNDQPTVVVPAKIISAEGYLVDDQMKKFINGLYELLPEEQHNTSVTNISVDNITVKQIDNAKLAIDDSDVLNATITDKISTQQGIKVPVEAYEDATVAEKMLTPTEMTELLTGLCALFGEETYISSVSADVITVKNINEAKTNIAKSLVLNATVTANVVKGDVIVPEESFEASSTELLTEPEINYLIGGLVGLLNENDKVNNINVNSITLAKLAEASGDIANSNILNATITSKIATDDVVVPNLSYKDVEATDKMLKVEEMQHLLSGLSKLLGDSAVSNIIVSNITIGNLKEAKEDISTSTVLRATISKQVVNNEQITAPAKSYDLMDSDNKKVITSSEIESFIDVVGNLFASTASVTGLPVNDLTLTKLNNASDDITASWILKATITSNINDKKQDGTIVIPSIAYDSNNILINDEIKSILAGLEGIFGDSTIGNISGFSGLSLANINNSMTHVADSYILRATVSRELVEVPTIIIPRNDIDSSVVDATSLTKDSMKALFSSITAMNIDGFGSITTDNLKIKKENAATITASSIMRATITQHIKINNVNIYALATDAEVVDKFDALDSTAKVLMLKSDELTKIINAVNVISSNGSLDITLDLTTILGFDTTSLDVVLASNTIRIEVSDILISNISSIPAFLLPSVTPIVETVYEIPSTTTSTHEVYSLEAIKSLLTILASI